jgi:hypothetical protein
MGTNVGARSSGWAAAAACAVLAGAAAGAEDGTPAYVARAQSRTADKLRVSGAALSAAESAALYGVPLAEKGFQPVWIEVENGDSVPYWLLFPGLDPGFLPPSEAAEIMARTPDVSGELVRRFRELAFHNPVPPGGKVSGFVLTRLHEGVKMLHVDLFGNRRGASVSFLVEVPGLRADYERSQERRDRLLATAEDREDVTDEAALRAALEALPCCVTNKKGSKPGDPLNLVVIGSVEDAFPAFIRRGWTPTEVTWRGSVLRMIRSALARERYAYAPISDLYLFGRPQDIALQKARDNIHQRNHLRLWRTTMDFRGKPVWVGQISRDIGSRLTIHSPTLTTHKIDPDVDEAALALAEDLAYSQGLQAFGFVGGVGAAPKEAPRRNLTNDPYYTSGRRLILIFDAEPTPITGIHILQWRGP